MKSYALHLVPALGIAAWAVFAYAYLGIEDGSSGLSFLGWIHVTFFIPGGILMMWMKGSHGNADLPVMFIFSGLCYLAISAGLFECIRRMAVRHWNKR